MNNLSKTNKETHVVPIILEIDVCFISLSMEDHFPSDVSHGGALSVYP